MHLKFDSLDKVKHLLCTIISRILQKLVLGPQWCVYRGYPSPVALCIPFLCNKLTLPSATATPLLMLTLHGPLEVSCATLLLREWLY